MQLSCLLTLLAVVGSKFAPSGENYSAYSIGKTLFSGVLEELQARHTAVAELAANDTDGWSRRRGAVRRILRFPDLAVGPRVPQCALCLGGILGWNGHRYPEERVSYRIRSRKKR